MAGLEEDDPPVFAAADHAAALVQDGQGRDPALVYLKWTINIFLLILQLYKYLSINLLDNFIH